MFARSPAAPDTDALAELGRLETLLPEIEPYGRWEVLTHVSHGELRYPIHGIVLGSAPPSAPVLVMIGGVHGLERIGTEVVIAYLTAVVRQLAWDALLRDSLTRTRIVFVPLLNPIGMALRRRSNGNGVDLMRNAPVHPDGWGTPLVGGQRISPRLPWFMGPAHAPMEAEAQALERFVRREVFGASVAIAVDVHSGFGMVDRIWFPYARTRKPLPDIGEIWALKELIDHSLPNHVYQMEPQAQTYTIQGDLWDHLYDAYREERPDGTFVPLTLELGSWLWVKKNPIQLLSVLGSFNPIKPHRLRRTLRRHVRLFELLHRATASPAGWCHLDPERRNKMHEAAFRRWFGR